MSSEKFTCITCRVGFQDGDGQRRHYREDWHLYNLKRKVVGLPPVSAEAFNSNVALRKKQMSESQQEDETTFECRPCGKKFSTRNAFNNHNASKKHKERAKKRAARENQNAEQEQHEHEREQPPAKQVKEGSTGLEKGEVQRDVAAKANEASPSHATVTPTPNRNIQDFAVQKARYEKLFAHIKQQQEDEQAHEHAQPSIQGATTSTTSSMASSVSRIAKNVDVGEDDDDGDDDNDAFADSAAQELTPEDEKRLAEEEPVLDLVDCIFDTYRADTLEDLIEYMSKEHGFFIPNLEYIADMAGFVRYLQLKVGNYFTCITCNKCLTGLEAVRQHMEDKGHKQVDYTEEGQLELGEYYDFSSTYPDDDILESDEARDAPLHLVPVASRTSQHQALVVSDDLELTLPSGARVGHRELSRFYKQRFRKADTRESVILGRIGRQYKMLGYGGSSLPSLEIRRDRNAAQRWQKKKRLEFGVKANKLQHHFRAQVMV